MEFLRNLMGNRHEPDWTRGRQPQFREYVPHLIRHSLVECVGITDFVVSDFKFNSKPWLVAVCEFGRERLHDVLWRNIDGICLAPGDKNSGETVPSLAQGRVDLPYTNGEVNGSCDVEIACKARCGVAKSELQRASALYADPFGQHLANDGVCHHTSYSNRIAVFVGEPVYGDVKKVTADRLFHCAISFLISFVSFSPSSDESHPSSLANSIAARIRSGKIRPLQRRMASRSGWHGIPL